MTSDLAELQAAALAYLAWEQELSGLGVPEIRAGAPAAQAGPGAPSAGAAAARPGAGEERMLQAPSLPAPAEGAPAREASAPGRSAAAPAPGLSSAARRLRLTQLDTDVQSCTRCDLAKTRTHTVFARGNPDSPVVFVGEGPGQEEDKQGSPFVGPAGQLLDKMIAAMGFARDDVYICNVVKCRPPGNRTPLPSEAGACAPFLLGQIEAIAPRVIVALGRCAAENMGLVDGGGWRGRWGKFQGVDVMPTYHPAFLLRSPEYKRPVWEDLQKVMARLKGA